MTQQIESWWCPTCQFAIYATKAACNKCGMTQQQAKDSGEADKNPGITVFEGRLKSYMEHTGFGFIDCQATKLMYGCDVFVHRSEGQRMRVGSRVTFQVHVNKKGQPQANNVKVVAQQAPDVLGLSHQPTVEQILAGASAGLAGPFLGRVKANDPQKGYGFITCAETQALYNADVFLHRTEGQGLEPGQEVYFQVHTNHQGKPQATRVSGVARKRPLEKSGGQQGVRQQRPEMPPVEVPPEAKAGWESMGWQLNSPQQGQEQAQWQPSESGQQDGLFIGIVKSFKHWSRQQGYGFIQCDETFQLFGCDIFLHPNEAHGLQVGSQVQFRIHLNGVGKPQANSVTAIASPAKQARTDAGPSFALEQQLHQFPEFPGGPFTGRVKSYITSTGYGCIECAETEALFGHHIILQQVMQGLDVGSKVSFRVRLNELGQPQAHAVGIIPDVPAPGPHGGLLLPGLLEARQAT